jgi:hypothetical protein
MPSALRLREDRPLFDVASYARQGPQHRDQFFVPAELEQIARTVRHVPEVMVKVSGGGPNAGAVLAHLKYISRRGDLKLETDRGELMAGTQSLKDVIAEWGLDLEARAAASPYRGVPGRKPTKLVHNVVLSMPAGTPAVGLLKASRAFAKEQFALKYRYALVLHTDQPHPHVHLVVKAAGEEGRRLNIKKATLREWRHEFARQLRAQGIAANATERAVRGVSRSSKRDGIYRATRRGRSTRLSEQVMSVAAEAQRTGAVKAGPGKSRLVATRARVEAGLRGIGEALRGTGHERLAEEVERFVRRMPPARTEREWIAEGLLKHLQARRERDRSPPVR